MMQGLVVLVEDFEFYSKCSRKPWKSNTQEHCDPVYVLR